MKASGYLIRYNREDFYYINTSMIPNEIYYELFTNDDEQVETWFDSKKDIEYHGIILSISGSNKEMYAVIEVDKTEIVINLYNEINHKNNRIHKSDIEKRLATNYGCVGIEMEDCNIPVTITPYLII
jgi:hypothetical protein